MNLQALEYRTKNPEKYRERSMDYRKADPVKHYKGVRKALLKRRENPVEAELLRARDRARNRANPNVKRNSRMKRTYGITLLDFEELKKQQKQMCAVCGKPFLKTTPHIDHDHKTGVVRGLLCSHCNIGIGNLMDNPRILENAITYLKIPRLAIGEITCNYAF